MMINRIGRARFICQSAAEGLAFDFDPSVLQKDARDRRRKNTQ